MKLGLLLTLLLTIFVCNINIILASQQSCMRNCKWCDFTARSCKLCQDGFFLYKSNDKSVEVCAPCVTGCKKCLGADFSECYELSDGWRQISDTEIEPCGISGCKNCNFEKQMCRGCSPGYVGVLTNDGNWTACKRCSQFKQCRICQEDLDTCSKCYEGYDLTESGTCEKNEEEKCKKYK